MSLEQLDFYGHNKIEVATMRLQEFCPEDGYYFADSGGKDSCVVRKLLEMSGCKYDAHYSQGGIDPPELVYFIKENHPETIFEKPAMSIWRGIEQRGMPRRQSRWCCELIKEQHGHYRFVVTGIRWQESSRRALRKMVEYCRTDGSKRFLHPIIDWTVDNVWEFIRKEHIPYCSLYDEGFKRIGCVLCPMETAKQTQVELKRFPKIAGAWHRACIRYWERGTEGTKRWQSGDDMWQWWLSRKSEPRKTNQCIMFDN